LSTISDQLKQVTSQLTASSDTAALDAQVLLANILGKSRTWVLAHSEATISPKREAEISIAVERLESGQPLPYILGKWEFYGLTFSVGPEALIPRPETELLIELALDWLQAHPGSRKAVDVGTGTGCITVALNVHVCDLEILACDISYQALKLARDNARRHQVTDRVDFLQADLLSPIACQYNLICANLPYISTHKLQSLPVAQNEPCLALDGGPEGLDLIKDFLAQSTKVLSPGGLILLEIEASQGRKAFSLAKKVYPSAGVKIIPDLAGRDRILQIQSAIY